jgi:hypothetical protein
MSCTSPFTVASTIFPCAFTVWPAATIAAFSASMNGVRCATAFFITRADFTTCGRNILPAPNRSPTTPIPSISGPSITSSGRPSFTRASSASARCTRRFPSPARAQSAPQPCRCAIPRPSFRFSTAPAPAAFSFSPCSTSRSVASGAPIQQHILHQHLQLRLNLLVHLQHARHSQCPCPCPPQWRDKETPSASPRAPCYCRES